MAYLVVKALHVVFVVAWFAGFFYLPRLFVYHADATNPTSDERFKVMERRLFAMMTGSGSLAAVFGLTLLVLSPSWLAAGWLQAKLALVAGLVVYHIWCGRLLSAFRDGRNRHSARFYRVFNEVPGIFLLLIVFLVILKPF